MPLKLRLKLNDHLNNTIGPRVNLKLQRYSSDLELGRDLPTLGTELVLEIMQNSLRHGRATAVDATFT